MEEGRADGEGAARGDLDAVPILIAGTGRQAGQRARHDRRRAGEGVVVLERVGAGRAHGQRHPVRVARHRVIAGFNVHDPQPVGAGLRRGVDDALVVRARQRGGDLGAAGVVEPGVDVTEGVGELEVDLDQLVVAHREDVPVLVVGARGQRQVVAAAQRRRVDVAVVVLERVGADPGRVQLHHVPIAGHRVVAAGGDEHRTQEVGAVGRGGVHDPLVVGAAQRRVELCARGVEQPGVDVAARRVESHVDVDDRVVADVELVPVFVAGTGGEIRIGAAAHLRRGLPGVVVLQRIGDAVRQVAAEVHVGPAAHQRGGAEAAEQRRSAAVLRRPAPGGEGATGLGHTAADVVGAARPAAWARAAIQHDPAPVVHRPALRTGGYARGRRHTRRGTRDRHAVAVAGHQVVAGEDHPHRVGAGHRGHVLHLLVIGAAERRCHLSAAGIVDPQVDVAGGVQEREVDGQGAAGGGLELIPVLVVGARRRPSERARAEHIGALEKIVVLVRIGARRADVQAQIVAGARRVLVATGEHHPNVVGASAERGVGDPFVVGAAERDRHLCPPAVVESQVDVALGVGEGHGHVDQLVVRDQHPVPVLVERTGCQPGLQAADHRRSGGEAVVVLEDIGARITGGQLEAVAVARDLVVAGFEEAHPQKVVAGGRRRVADPLVVGAGEGHRDLGAGGVVEAHVDVPGGVEEPQGRVDQLVVAGGDAVPILVVGAGEQGGVIAAGDRPGGGLRVVVLEGVGAQRPGGGGQIVLGAGDDVVPAGGPHVRPQVVRPAGGGEHDTLAVRAGQRRVNLAERRVVQAQVHVALGVDEVGGQDQQLVVDGVESIVVEVWRTEGQIRVDAGCKQACAREVVVVLEAVGQAGRRRADVVDPRAAADLGRRADAAIQDRAAAVRDLPAVGAQ